MKLAALLFLLAGEGTIGGRVRDPSGEPLADCLVVLESEKALLERVERTDADGAFLLASLPAGSYRLRVSRPGFRDSSIDGVGLSSGAHRELLVTLARGEIEPGIELLGAESLESRGFAPSTTLDRDFLDEVPTARTPWSAVELTPGLVSDRIDVGGSETARQSRISAAGTSPTQNQYLLDGVDVTDPAALGSSATYYAFDSFEEIRVSTWGSGAEVPAPGVVIDIALAEGGRAFAGGAALYFENEWLQGSNLDPALRAHGVPPSNALGSLYDWSARLGGPLLRDRASFYAGYGAEHLERSALGFFLPDGEPGVDATDLSTAVGKGTVELGPNQSLSLLFFRNHKRQPHRDAGRLRPTPETTLFQASTTRILQAGYVLARGGSLLDVRFDAMHLDFPLGERPDALPDAYSRIELTNGVWSGGPGTDQHFRRNRYRARASLSRFSPEWLGGSSDVLLGWESGFQRASTRGDLNGAIVYRDFFGSPIQVELLSDPVTTEGQSSDLALFARERFARGPIGVDLGVRLERWKGGYPDQARAPGRWEEFFRSRGLPSWTAGNEDAIAFTSLAPRLGIVWSPFADGRTLLRGSYGRLYHRVGTELATYASPAGRASALFRFDDANGNRILDAGEIDLESPLAVSLPAGSEIDPALSQPRTDEVTLGVERELGPGLSASATLLYRVDRELIDDVNDGVPDSAFVERRALDPGRDLAIGTADDRVLTVFDQRPESLGADRFRLTNPPGLRSRYRGVLFEAQRRGPRLGLLASLALSESEGYLPGPGWEGEEGSPSATPLFNEPNRLTNAKGRTFWDRPRILRLTGWYQSAWQLRFAFAYRYQTGQPMYRSILVSSTLDGDPLHQGPIEVLAEPQGAAVQPAIHLLDLRAEKSFRIGRGGTIDLMVDLFNALNANTATSIASRRGAFGAILEVLPPRVARIGIRYRFGSGR